MSSVAFHSITETPSVEVRGSGNQPEFQSASAGENSTVLNSDHEAQSRNPRQRPKQRQQQQPNRSEGSTANQTNQESRGEPGSGGGRQPTNRPRAAADGEQDEEEEIELKYGAEHVIKLFIPVSICMGVVILTMNTVGYYARDDKQYLIYTPFTSPTNSASTLALQSVGNALVVLCVVVVMTTVLILLYKFRCYKVIHGWLIGSSLLLLTFFTLLYLHEVFREYNLSLDFFTAIFIMWNYGTVGMICIHWKGPLLLQQAYLILISALMALVFIKFLPEWTVWTVLAVISLWDLVAVLCPKGPLRILVETAQEPGVMYPYTLVTMSDTAPISQNEVRQHSSSTSSGSSSSNDGDGKRKRVSKPNQGEGTSNPAMSTENTPQPVRRIPVPPEDQPPSEQQAHHHGEAARQLNGNGGAARVAVVSGVNNPNNPGISYSANNTNNNPSQRPQQRPRQQQQEDDDEDESGVKLGLGDFIFYSVLVGKASSYGDWSTTIACYISILIGLSFTLILLAVFRKALPALPISIAFGLLFYFTTSYIIAPFTNTLAMVQAFV